MRGHASVHIAAEFPTDPLMAEQTRGRLSVMPSDDAVVVWLTGTPDELRTFAVGLAEHVDTYETNQTTVTA